MFLILTQQFNVPAQLYSDYVDMWEKVIGVPSWIYKGVPLRDFNFFVVPSSFLCFYFFCFIVSPPSSISSYYHPNLVFQFSYGCSTKNYYFQFDEFGPFFQGEHGKLTNFQNISGHFGIKNSGPKVTQNDSK